MMGLPPLNSYTPNELLLLSGLILNELQSRGVVRTRNNPVSGYTEWLVSTRLNLRLAANSNKGFDAVDVSGRRYEIKARRLTPRTRSAQLSAIRDISGEHFDFLIAVVYNKDFEIILALRIPRSVVVEKSSYVKATNSYKLMAEYTLKEVPGVEDITQLLR